MDLDNLMYSIDGVPLVRDRPLYARGNGDYIELFPGFLFLVEEGVQIQAFPRVTPAPETLEDAAKGVDEGTSEPAVVARGAAKDVDEGPEVVTRGDCFMVGDVQLRPRDLSTLDDLRWLNDVVIDAYYVLLRQELTSIGVQDVHIESTYFYTALTSGHTSRDGYAKVRRWTRAAKLRRMTGCATVNSIFDLRLVIVPIHTGGNHWISFRIHLDVERHPGQLRLLWSLDDSLGVRAEVEEQVASRMLYWMQCESIDKRGGVQIPVDAWIKEGGGHLGGRTPRQDNGCDCGMFQVLSVSRVALSVPWTDVTPSSIPGRRAALKRLLQGAGSSHVRRDLVELAYGGDRNLVHPNPTNPRQHDARGGDDESHPVAAGYAGGGDTGGTGGGVAGYAGGGAGGGDDAGGIGGVAGVDRGGGDADGTGGGHASGVSADAGVVDAQSKQESLEQMRRRVELEMSDIMDNGVRVNPLVNAALGSVHKLQPQAFDALVAAVKKDASVSQLALQTPLCTGGVEGRMVFSPSRWGKECAGEAFLFVRQCTRRPVATPKRGKGSRQKANAALDPTSIFGNDTRSASGRVLLDHLSKAMQEAGMVSYVLIDRDPDNVHTPTSLTASSLYTIGARTATLPPTPVSLLFYQEVTHPRQVATLGTYEARQLTLFIALCMQAFTHIELVAVFPLLSDLRCWLADKLDVVNLEAVPHLDETPALGLVCRRDSNLYPLLSGV